MFPPTNAGQFKLEISLSEQEDESDLRKAIATGKHYIAGEDGCITLLDRKSVEQLHQSKKQSVGRLTVLYDLQ